MGDSNNNRGSEVSLSSSSSRLQSSSADSREKSDPASEQANPHGQIRTTIHPQRRRKGGMLGQVYRCLYSASPGRAQGNNKGSAMTDIQKDVVETEQDVFKIKKTQELALSVQQMEDLQKSRIWLGGLEGNLDSENDRNRKLHTAGTCEWILDHKVFRAWLDFKEPILLISGIPGAGKSVLLSFILRKLQETLSNGEGDLGGKKDTAPPILYFFFKNGNLKTESAVTMIATLVDQFIQQHPTAEAVNILNSARQKSNSKHCRNPTDLWSLFVELRGSFSKDYGPVSILIDALDECSELRLEFFEHLVGATYDWKALGVRFILTTRPEDGVMESLEPEKTSGGTNKCLLMKFDKETVNRDIAHYVTKQTITKKYKKLLTCRKKLVGTLPAKSEGTFRYAALMLDQLLKPLAEDVEKTLAMIPSGLNNMYAWILEHLGDGADDLLLRKTVFLWVALAFRPITVSEIALAYAASNHDYAEAPFDPSKKRLIDSHDILRTCGPLIEVTSEMTLAVPCFSVREFLLLKWDEGERDAIMRKGPLVTECLIPDPIMGHEAILDICRTHLLSKTFLHTLQSPHGYTTYSITHCIKHAVAAEKRESFADEGSQKNQENPMNPIWQAVYKFLSETNPSLSVWKKKIPKWDIICSEACLPIYKQEKPFALQTLHAIACTGLSRPLADARIPLADFEKEVECRDAEGASPLIWAARKGHHDIVRILLERDVDSEAKDNGGRTSLFWASLHGHIDVVKQLLEKGADVEAKDNGGCTPLCKAAMLGHIDVVKQLLEKGADVEAKDNGGCTPSLWAARNDHIDVVKQLWKIWRLRVVMLSWLSRWRHLIVIVVNLLLGKCANAKAKGNENWIRLSVIVINIAVIVVPLLSLCLVMRTSYYTRSGYAWRPRLAGKQALKSPQ